MSVSIEYLSSCLPDYFSGHHNPVIQIPIYSKMTHRDMLNAIIEEINYCWELYSDALPDDDKEIEDIVKNIFDNYNAGTLCFDEEIAVPIDEFEDSVCAFFVINTSKDEG
jgi:hypothetical protein